MVFHGSADYERLTQQHDFEPWSMKCRMCRHTLHELQEFAAKGGTVNCVDNKPHLFTMGRVPPAEPPTLEQVRTRRTRVYVAGPMLTSGNPYLNVRHGLSVGTTLMKRGYLPFIPHLTALWEIAAHEEFTYEDWLSQDFEYIGMSDALLRLDGPSKGADREVAEATRLGKPVYYSIDTLVACERPTRSV